MANGGADMDTLKPVAPGRAPPLAPRPDTQAAESCALALHFGAGVRELRKQRGWSQERLAENAALNRSYISEIERGCVIASLLTVEKLALALQVAASTLVIRGEELGQKNLL